jgi:adenine-specific DNA-methyltransferase
MAKVGSKDKGKKKVETLTHVKASRLNIPTAEYQSVMRTEELSPVRVAYERRNRDLDPQLVWKGKDEQDWSDLVVAAPPLYIQEKIHPKVLIDDLRRRTDIRVQATEAQIDLFANFNGLPTDAAKTEFYQHDAHWSNRMILGDGLQVMASLAEREGLRGKVQCVYFDPPYGISFNSNFQWSTTSRTVIDGKVEHITREPEQVKAFRDAWRDGVHSYLTYLRDRLTVARDLLHESGSIFVQIGHENVHRVRALMDEVFGDECLVCEIVAKKKGAQKSTLIDPVNDFILWYSKSSRESGRVKFRTLYEERNLDFETVDYFSRAELTDGRILNLKNKDDVGDEIDYRLFPKLIEKNFPGARLLRQWPITNGGYRENQMAPVSFRGADFPPPKNRCWSHTSKPIPGELTGMDRVKAADRLMASGISLDFKRYYDDFPFKNIANWWDGFRGALDQIYVVQTNERLVERCLLMATDPGDLVLDPTCGSGTTAFVAEQWGRRWITIDTSRVAVALARGRIMGARYPYYLLADSVKGKLKEAELTGVPPSERPAQGNIRQGFVYRRGPYLTSGHFANNSEIDVICEKYQTTLDDLRTRLNALVKQKWADWEIPRTAADEWANNAKEVHAEWRKQRLAQQKEIDASTAAKTENVYFYDKPYEDNQITRVAGPFTVESLSPHRVLSVGEDDELLQKSGTFSGDKDDEADFVAMILENLRTSGVQQAHKEDKITFSSIAPWPGYFVCAEGKYTEANGKSGAEKRAAIFIGPEFGTVSRPDLVAAAREAGDAGFDLLITCAFNYDAHSSEFNKLGKIPVLKARMNADLHMSDELKNTGKGNLFVIFGEPDIEIRKANDGQIEVKIIGVDVFDPTTGEVRSDGAEGIACWFVDDDYNEESFFVRQAYFLGANDPYKALKATLKAEINEEAWATLHSDTSRPFDKPRSGRIAVKVINHLGDEVMKIFKV